MLKRKNLLTKEVIMSALFSALVFVVILLNIGSAPVDVEPDGSKATLQSTVKESIPEQTVRSVTINADVLGQITGYGDTVLSYASEVIEDYGFTSAEVFDCCADPEYGGYSVHIVYDDLRYQCIWINPANMECLLLYDCDLTLPMYKNLFK